MEAKHLSAASLLANQQSSTDFFKNIKSQQQSKDKVAIFDVKKLSLNILTSYVSLEDKLAFLRGFNIAPNALFTLLKNGKKTFDLSLDIQANQHNVSGVFLKVLNNYLKSGAQSLGNVSFERFFANKEDAQKSVNRFIKELNFKFNLYVQSSEELVSSLQKRFEQGEIHYRALFSNKETVVELVKNLTQTAQERELEQTQRALSENIDSQMLDVCLAKTDNEKQAISTLPVSDNKAFSIAIAIPNVNPLWSIGKHQLTYIARTEQLFLNINAFGVGLGKAQPLSSSVYTMQGFNPLSDINVGDTVLCEKGVLRKVLNAFDHPEKEVYEITLNDGTKAEACEDHLWTLGTRSSYPLKDLRHHFTVTTKRIAEKFEEKARALKAFEKFERQMKDKSFDPELIPELLKVRVGSKRYKKIKSLEELKHRLLSTLPNTDFILPLSNLKTTLFEDTLPVSPYLLGYRFFDTNVNQEDFDTLFPTSCLLPAEDVALLDELHKKENKYIVSFNAAKKDKNSKSDYNTLASLVFPNTASLKQDSIEVNGQDVTFSFIPFVEADEKGALFENSKLATFLDKNKLRFTLPKERQLSDRLMFGSFIESRLFLKGLVNRYGFDVYRKGWLARGIKAYYLKEKTATNKTVKRCISATCNEMILCKGIYTASFAFAKQLQMQMLAIGGYADIQQQVTVNREHLAQMYNEGLFHLFEDVLEEIEKPENLSSVQENEQHIVSIALNQNGKAVVNKKSNEQEIEKVRYFKQKACIYRVDLFYKNGLLNDLGVKTPKDGESHYSGVPLMARQIVKVTKIGKMPVRCIEIDSPNHLYVTDNYIVTHNTSTALISVQNAHNKRLKKKLCLLPRHKH